MKIKSNKKAKFWENFSFLFPKKKKGDIVEIIIPLLILLALLGIAIIAIWKIVR